MSVCFLPIFFSCLDNAFVSLIVVFGVFFFVFFGACCLSVA